MKSLNTIDTTHDRGLLVRSTSILRATLGVSGTGRSLTRWFRLVSRDLEHAGLALLGSRVIGRRRLRAITVLHTTSDPAVNPLRSRGHFDRI